VKGKFRARAQEWGIGEAKTGTFQVGVVFELLDQEPGTTITWYGALTDAALEWTMKALRNMGWQGDDVTELDGNGGHLDANEVQLVVDEEEWEGKTRTKVKFVNSMGGLAMSSRVTGDKLKGFAAGLRGKILGLEPGRKPAPAAQPPRQPVRNDDIPF
jgi:hypothetical protein